MGRDKKTKIVYAAAALQELYSLKTKKYYEKVRYTAEKLKSTNCPSKWEYDHSCSVSRETTDVTVTRGMLCSDKV